MSMQENDRGEERKTLMSLIEELDDLMRESGSVPLFGGNRRVVYYDDVMAILDDMRVALPEDVIRAQEVLRSSESIIQDARETERRILLDANTRHDELVSEHTIMQDARAQAAQILAQADANAQTIVNEATEYAINMVEKLHKTSVDVISSLELTRDELVKMSRSPYGEREKRS